MEVDLHIHTTASDGVLMPSEIVRLAALNGVKAIAITDHDTIAGIDEALAISKEYEVEVIPGIEISSSYENKEVHILGYFINYKEQWFKDFLSEMKDSRFERAKKIVRKLNDAGVKIKFEDVLKNADIATIGRPHIARVLIDDGYATDISDAFNKYLVSGTPGFVERKKIPAQIAVDKIIQAGGVPVLAHPGLLYNTDVNILIQDLKVHGLKGIEVYHSSHDIETTKRIYKLGLKHRLVLTGGSDYHGDRGGRAKVELGSVGVTLDMVEALKKLKDQITKQNLYYEIAMSK